jgi:hypothetical protein
MRPGLIFLVAALMGTTVLAEDSPANWRRNRLTMSPAALFMTSGALEYEYAPDERFSFHLGPQNSVSPGMPGGRTITTFEGVGGARFFPLEHDRAPAGLWVGAESRLGRYFASAPALPLGFGGRAEYGLSAGFLATGGYTLVSDFGFTGSLGAGVGATPGGARFVSMGPSLHDGPGIDFTLHANVGYAF